ncbi:GNAT family N-acetyltransferase [Zavarzinia compransoris]|uniref:GNAT family N-acetyltransferase n=1 Tax=Zavarzinia marina TaxID=2911065 RepID=UPI001F31760D|nr:GNAT family N-acetyltransferase [Zavarzinia marina]MCF4164665.1 GNAT family N-acetyltransferase [Zavarzinia marina]
MELQAPELLTDAHILTDFDSGVASLDDWLRRRAMGNQLSGASRIYVVAPPDKRVAGYYALASGALAHVDAPGRIKRNMPDPVPMAVLGRLAIDRSMQGRGLGVALLQDAVLRVKQAGAIMGIRGVLVHAISEEARAFYEHHGFIPSVTSPLTLLLSVA